jgi:acyl-CoA synthetase (AMP-forming)/AMP-acid ligase II
VISKIRRKFPNARIVQTYACTEAASSLTFLNIDSTFLSASKGNTSKHLSGDSVGSPPQHIEIRLYKKSGKATKIVTLPNQVGVIATRGSHVMNGYWNRGGKNININGWLITSDLGYWLPTGELCFSGRLKDVIRSGGETVLANEVERVILKHPDVSECAVFPLKDERFGETVACAIIVERPLQLVAIRAWCGDQGLASYKRPRYLFLVDKLPRNSSGKVLKHKLVAIYGRNPTSRL